MKTRTCITCSVAKSLKDFSVGYRRKDGSVSHRAWCKACVRAWSKKHYFATTSTSRRNDMTLTKEGRHANQLSYFQGRVREYKSFVNELKVAPCVDCSQSFPPVCMDFDHVLPGKKYAVAQMSNHRREAVQAELERCELVCCNCHRVRTQKRRSSNTHAKQPAQLWKLLVFREWMNSVKNTPCVDCAGCFSPVAMDFDHVRGVKIKGVSAMWSWRRERVEEEMAKCDLVCGNCHRLRTERRVRAKAAA